MGTASFEACQALPPVVFPLSGPPVCVTMVHPVYKGTIRTVHNERTGTSLIQLTRSILHPTTMAEKFYLEPSQQHEGLVHIRCCGNNKYWVAEQHEHDGRSAWFICGSADEPEEDPAKPSCTLFEFRHVEGDTRLIHHQQKKHVLLVEDPSTPLSKKGDLSTVDFVLEVRDDLEDIGRDIIFSNIWVHRLWVEKQLPRYVAFKGNNGKYLTPKDPYLQFSSDDNKDPAVVHETFTDEYGIIRIRSISSGKFWRVRPEGWVCAESSNAAYIYKGGPFSPDGRENIYADVDTLFKMVINSGNYVALQSISNGKFCKRFTNEVMTSGLSALVEDSSTSDEVELEIEEPVKSREIYDVRYRFAEAKKTSTKREPYRTLLVGTNRADDAPAQSQITIEQYERTERWWDATLSFDVGFETSLKASVPILKGLVDIEGSAGFHAKAAGEYKWGKSEENKKKTSTTITIPIGPKTRKTCIIFAAKEVLEVPFSYRKKDVLYSGEVVHSALLHDGVYRGMEVNEIDFDITSEHVE